MPPSISLPIYFSKIDKILDIDSVSNKIGMPIWT